MEYRLRLSAEGTSEVIVNKKPTNESGRSNEYEKAGDAKEGIITFFLQLHFSFSMFLLGTYRVTYTQLLSA